MSDTFKTGAETEARKEQPRKEQPREERPRREDREDRHVGEETVERINNFFSAGRASFNGITNKLLAQMTEVFESTASEYDNPQIDPALSRKNFKIHPLDTGSVGSIPTLLICLPTKVGSKEVVIHYSLVLEPTGPQRFKTIRSEHRDRDDLQLPVFVEDYMDDRWHAAIERTMTNIYAGQVFGAGSQIIPGRLVDDQSEVTSRETIATIFGNAIDAICATREEMIINVGGKVNAQRITPEFVDENNRFSVTVDSSRTPKRDTSGNPIRSDIALTVFHESIIGGSSRRDREDRIPTSRPIGTISLAIDLQYVGEQSGAFGGFHRQEEELPFFQPVLNITDMVGAPGVPWALESSLLVIGAASLMSDNYRWVEPMRNRGSNRYKSLEALDTLMLAHPDPDRREIAEGINSMTPDGELGDYLNQVVYPDLYFGMVMNPAGEKAWANKVFEAIALADTDREVREYCEILYDAADNLTNNKFRACMEEDGFAGELPVRSVDTRVFTGRFIDKDGNDRDIREWTPTAMLNFKSSDPREAMGWMLDYQDTLLPSNSVELNQDLAERYRFLTDTMGSSAFHIDGTAEAIQLETWFVRTLSRAMHESGMMPHIADSTGLRTRSRRSSGFSGDRARDLSRNSRRSRDSDRGGRRPRY